MEGAAKIVQPPSLAMAIPSPARSGRGMIPNAIGHEMHSSASHGGQHLSGYGMHDSRIGGPVAGQGVFQNGGGSHGYGPSSLNDGRSHTVHVVPPRRPSEPWDLPGSADCDPSPEQAGMSGYREHLRTNGQQAMQRTWNRGILPNGQNAGGMMMPMSNGGGHQVAQGGEMIVGPVPQQLSIDAQGMQMHSPANHMGQCGPPTDMQFWAGPMPMSMPQMTLDGCQQMPAMMPNNCSQMGQMAPMMPDNYQQILSMMSAMQAPSASPANSPQNQQSQLMNPAIPDNSPQNQQSLMNILMPAGFSMDNAQMAAELQAAAQCEYED